MKGKILLTGVSGFLGSHTAIQLLEKGYEVVGTLRNSGRADSIKAAIGRHTKNTEQLSFVEADLLDEKIWYDLTHDIDFVQHIASPFPRTLPKHEKELIRPAKYGTLNVLKAASANNVKRVVVTSSMGAITYGREKNERSGTYDESSWTDFLNIKDSTAYFRSKTIAEKSAWNFMQKNGSAMELATVCPGAILGPVLEKDFGTSANLVIKILDGSSPALPDIGFDVVDVRSVADLLIRCMEMPEAANKRFVGAAGFMKFKDIALILKEEYPGKKIPLKILPNFMVRFFSNFDKSLQPILIDLGVERKADSSKARKLLKWKPLSNREAVISCAKSIMELELA